MGIADKIGKTALDLMENKDVLDKSTNIMGMLFPYAGLTKKALDMYIADVEKSDMSSESKLIAVLDAKRTIKKLKNQKRIAEIAVETAEDSTDFTERSGVNQEWLERFMDSAGFVSDEAVQLIWGEILGKEFEKPGSTPSNMIRILSEITPVYAQAFKKICSMQMLAIELDETDKVIDSKQEVLVPYTENQTKLDEIGLTFSIFNELETLGLIKFNYLEEYALSSVDIKHILLFVDGEVWEADEYGTVEIPFGNVMLTSAGKCLKKITPTETIAGYSEWVKKYVQEDLKLKETVNYKVSVDGNKIDCEKIRNAQQPYLTADNS